MISGLLISVSRILSVFSLTLLLTVELEPSMAKRRRENKPVIIDLDSPTSEGHDIISKHRTCWKHMLAAWVHARKGKITKQKMEGFKKASPCVLDTERIPCRVRSVRLKKKIKSHNAITETMEENNKNVTAEGIKEEGENAIVKVIKEKRKLDSGVFDCYFEHLWRSFSEERRSSFAYFDSLWFYLYKKRSSKAKVLKWIKKKQIFLKKSHWSLLIFCNFGESFQSKAKPCILLLDSLEMVNPRRLEPDIRKFVLDIYASEGRAENIRMVAKIPFIVPKVPQQRNGEECGHFVLYFINLFMQGAPENFSNDDHSYFMDRNWFTPECLEGFFQKLDLIEH